MRDMVEDVISISTSQRSQIHIAIEQPHFIAFANQRLDHIDQWRLPQIIRTRFEGEPKNTNTLLAVRCHHFKAFLNLALITGYQRVQQRQIQVETTTFIGE